MAEYFDLTKARTVLDGFFDEHLPVARFMDLKVADYDGELLSLSAPLASNFNDKLTAFGGSLYIASVMSCWGVMYLKMLERGHYVNQVVSEGNIKYLAPVTGEIIATATSPCAEDLDQYLNRFLKYGTARIEVSSEVLQDHNPAVRFQGSFALIPN